MSLKQTLARLQRAAANPAARTRFNEQWRSGIARGGAPDRVAVRPAVGPGPDMALAVHATPESAPPAGDEPPNPKPPTRH